MRVRTYDYLKGTVINESSQELNFGDVIQGQHCSRPVVLRVFPTSEVTITDLQIFLESKGTWEAEFGYYVNSEFVAGIESGSNELSNHFEEVPNATPASQGGTPLPTTDGISDYTWLDVDIASNQVGSTASNYRFTYNFT